MRYCPPAATIPWAYDFGDSGSVAPTSFFADGALAFATASGVTTGHLTADVVRAGLDYKLN